MLAFSVIGAHVEANTVASLIPLGADWDYLDDGSDQGTAWTANGFVTAGWYAGAAELGYGDNDEATTVEFGGDDNNKFVTTYFRHEFNIDDPASLLRFDLGVIRDDGVAVYFNGVELLRDSLAPGAAYNDHASAVQGRANETTPVSNSIAVNSLPPGTVVVGTNVVAAEIHQANLTSSDISFDLSLNAVTNSDLRLALNFDNAVDSQTLDVTDLLVDAAPTATGATLIDAYTVLFDFPGLAPGPHSVSIAAGSIENVGQEGLAPFNFSFNAAAEPQYVVKHNPRLQLGDAPLTGFSGSELDQVEILWQTQSGGIGTADLFLTEYRLAGAMGPWIPVTGTSQINTGVDNRIVHSLPILGLHWNTEYEYRIRHVRAGVLVNSYQHVFQTRHQAGVATPFSFAAYGDSAYTPNVQNFRGVQSRINQLDPAFTLLLGDNVYNTGSHTESDARFNPLINPEAADWIAGHVDYYVAGNHDAATAGGQPSRDNFSVPIPEEDITAPATPPANVPTEHNYSFDYGNVHIATIDSNFRHNVSTLDAMLTWLEADMAASTAKWKMVAVHHPIAFVPDKPENPDENYYQEIVSRLRAAGVDLFLAGHSHTYTWSFPLLGENNGQANFLPDSDRRYEEELGIVQLVSGLGGRSLRPGSFDDLATAAGFTTTTPTPSRYGFSLVEVTADELTVSYIAADDGAVIDSFVITEDDVITIEQSTAFQEGVSGYVSTSDTYLWETQPTADNSIATQLFVDGNDAGGVVQSLIQFGDIFGTNPGQIPLDAQISAALLQLEVTNPGDSLGVHRMLQPWSETGNWSSLASGIQLDDVEALSTPDASTGFVSTGLLSIDVTTSVEAWQNNPASEYGWALVPGGGDGVDFSSSEGSSPPRLVVAYPGPRNARWDGDNPQGNIGDSATWSNGNNWTVNETTDIAPAVGPPGDDIIFGPAPTVGIIDLEENRTVNSATFQNDYTLANATLTITSGAIAVDANVTTMIDSDLSADGSLSKTGDGTLVIRGAASDLVVHSGTVILGSTGTVQNLTLEDGSIAVLHGEVLGDLINGGHLIIGGDLNGDGVLDAADIDLLVAQIPGTVPQVDPLFDLVSDAVIDDLDVNDLVHNRIGTSYGDANLDRVVDGTDFGIWNSNGFQLNTGWAAGDFNGDQITDIRDFNIWNANKFTRSPGQGAANAAETSLRTPRAALATDRHAHNTPQLLAWSANTFARPFYVTLRDVFPADDSQATPGVEVLQKQLANSVRPLEVAVVDTVFAHSATRQAADQQQRNRFGDLEQAVPCESSQEVCRW